MCWLWVTDISFSSVFNVVNYNKQALFYTKNKHDF